MPKSHLVLALLAVPLGACGNANTDTASSPEAQRRSALYACEERAFVEKRPLVGAGFDRSRGGLLGEPQSSYVIFTSQAFPRAGQEELFRGLVEAISDQIDASAGAIAHAIGTDAGCGVGRTLSVWANEAALFDFAATGAHREGMTRGAEIFYSSKVFHWTANAEEVLSIDWEQARRALAAVPPVWFE